MVVELPEVFVVCRVSLLPCTQYSVGSCVEVELDEVMVIELPEVL